MKRKNPLCALLTVFLVAFVLVSDRTQAKSIDPDELENEKELLMVTGEQRVIDAAGVASFSESTRGIIEVKIPKSGSSLVVTAVRPGRTSLLLIRRNGKQLTLPITVFSKNPSAIESELQALLAEYPNVTFKRIGPRIFLDGSVRDEMEIERIKRVSSLYSGQVQSLVSIDPSVVRPRTNIRLDLTFVEMRAHSAWQMGTRWPSQVGATSGFNFSYDFVGKGMSATYNVVNQALPVLEAAAENGMAKIKKRATLITTSGKEATYSAGGEVNVAIAGSQAAELRTVSYGCSLTVLPHLDPAPGLLDLEVSAEVSDLTQTSQDVPGRTLSKVSTLVNLGLGQSIVLSGLDSFSQTKTKSGIPGLSKIPIVGMLFGTHNKREEKVDGIIAITPTVVSNVSKEGARLLKEALQKFEKFKG